MKFEDKILAPLGALGVGVILDIIGLLFDYESLFSLGMVIIAIALVMICLVVSLIQVETNKQ